MLFEISQFSILTALLLQANSRPLLELPTGHATRCIPGSWNCRGSFSARAENSRPAALFSQSTVRRRGGDAFGSDASATGVFSKAPTRAAANLQQGEETGVGDERTRGRVGDCVACSSQSLQTRHSLFAVELERGRMSAFSCNMVSG